MTVVNDLFAVILIIAISLFMYFKWKFSFWRKKGVPYIEPHIPFGTSENPLNKKQCSAIVTQNYYNYFKSLGHRYGGLYLSASPVLLLIDLKLIRSVMSKDFHHFTDRGVYHNIKDDPISGNLVNLEGQTWRNLRAKLTPTFTSGKIKQMFPILIACGNPLYATLNQFDIKGQPVDIKNVLARFTTDVIGSCAFGLDCNSFKEPEGDLRKYGKMFFGKISKLQSLKTLIAFSNPPLGRRLHITLDNQEATKFFLNAVKNVVAYRETNNITRNDFMQLLMNLRNDDGFGTGLTIEEVAAQATVFFLAGFETSSTTMTFCLCELAVNQDIQNRLRDEISKTLAKHGETITYEAIMEMKYLNQVIEETLRKYPPVPTIPRICVQDYKIPETEIVIEKGTRVAVSAYALHHDPEYFSEPEKFEPERFSDTNKANISPFSYLPFGEGPRVCIGLRFGLLQAKVGLVLLLKDFRFTLNSKTKFPLELSKYSFILSAESGVWLDANKISK